MTCGSPNGLVGKIAISTFSPEIIEVWSLRPVGFTNNITNLKKKKTGVSERYNWGIRMS